MSNKILDIVHTDVCGKFPVKYLNGSLYLVSFIDEFTRYSWVYAIRNKSEVYKTFVNWLELVKKRPGKNCEQCSPTMVGDICHMRWTCS